jgi:hypothetical protein
MPETAIPARIPDGVFRGQVRCTPNEFILLVTILNEVCRPGASAPARIADDELANWAGLTLPTFFDFRRRLENNGLIAYRLVTGARGLSEYWAAESILAMGSPAPAHQAASAEGAAL